MSDPSRLFRNLHLDEMPVTRSQANATAQRGGRGRNTRSVRGRGARGGAHRSPQLAPIQSYTGNQYYTQALSPTSARRANEGLESNFLVDRIQNHDSDGENYYAFQLRTPVAVRIHEPDGGRARMECSCEAHRITQSECAHIYWLFAGLHAVLASQQAAPTQRPTPIEISLTARLGELYPLIQQHEASLRQELNRIRGDELEAGLDELDMQQQFSEFDMETRIDDLCDILSSFDRDLIPGEFKHRFVDFPAPEMSPVDGGSLVRDSLPATIYHLAFRDDALYVRLKQVVPHDIRAAQYYQTQYSRARKVLLLLSRYSQNGPSIQHVPENDRNIDVPECARRLRSIVDQICEDRDRRNALAPVDGDILRRLSAMLAELIRRIVALDRDIYATPAWARIQPPTENPRDRNLFVYLIGDPPCDPELPHWMSDNFAIDRLSGFPTTEWSHLLELFTTIKDEIEEKDMDALPGSIAYVSVIDDMVQEYTSTADEPSSSSAQMRRT